MIMAIRHPMKWLESFYNHRIHNEFALPNATSLIGSCSKGTSGACANRSDFHFYLSRLGLTPMVEEEIKLMPSQSRKRKVKRFNMTARVFLYEV
mmetsp:Transcript_20010/g.30316  ORF Transcript_20010/g.30316 Transcript_20010/m.30316 type:complete len:94 (+) Transcript_20010:3-284(+)